MWCVELFWKSNGCSVVSRLPLESLLALSYLPNAPSAPSGRVEESFSSYSKSGHWLVGTELDGCWGPCEEGLSFLLTLDMTCRDMPRSVCPPVLLWLVLKGGEQQTLQTS